MPINFISLAERASKNLRGGHVDPVVVADGRVATQFVDENGVAYGIKQVDGKLRVSSMPYLWDIAEGHVPGHEIVRVFGHNEDVGVTWETVYDADILKPWLAAAERLQIASTDADDDGAPVGNGARTVRIDGLATGFVPLSETVTMNGIANVLTDASFLRVSGMEVITAGATGYNEGAITASNNADTDVLAAMDMMENSAHGAYYTVPAGYTLYVVGAIVSEASTKGSKFALFAREDGDLWRMIEGLGVVLDSAVNYPMPAPLIFPAKTDVEIRCRAVLAGAVVTASFYGWIEL